ERLGREESATELRQPRQVLEQLPDLALRPASIGRRIEKNDVVAVSTSLFALGELHRIFDDPANRLVGEARDFLVLAGPSDCFPGSIDMRDHCAGARCDERGEAGIAE